MQIFSKNSAESYPSPSSSTTDEDTKELLVLFDLFTEEREGEYRCRISTEKGHVLIDTNVQSTISSQTLDALRLTMKLSGRRHQRKQSARSVCLMTKSLRPDDTCGEWTIGREHILEFCIKILAPDAKDLSDSIGMACDDVLRVCSPEFATESIKAWSPRDFYDNVHVPQAGEAQEEFPIIDQLQCKLYPFQKRAVRWLLQREGTVKYHNQGRKAFEFPHGFVRTSDAEGKTCLMSKFLGITTTDEDLPSRLGNEPRGGILAEEMGLGKTVEMIALICLHRRDASEHHLAHAELPLSPATLIITPPAILQQWRNEFELLAPSLNVMIYEGLRIEAGKSNHAELLSRCLSQDVVLTTYNTLAKEVHYAETAGRELRHEKKYEKRLSPLTQIEWWRVVLDEAQMIESGVSNAARVAKLIPRKLAWCVSGTPVKKDARDLFGLLDFLHFRPYNGLQPQIWNHVVTHHKDVFKQLFRTIALRHTKNQIKNEVGLPPQKRVVITVPFTHIEEQHYSSLFKEMSEDCGLNLDGAPLAVDWDPESLAVIEKMRNWLARLRQTCLHPEVGAKNRRALGNGKGPLRTVGEVLEVMIEQNDTAIRSEERALLLSQIRRGQILEHAELSGDALKIWLHTLEEAKSVVEDCRKHLKSEIHRLGLTEDLLLMGDMSEIAGASASRTGPHRLRLRAAIEIEHMCTFFIASACFQIKTDETKTKPISEEFKKLEQEEELMYERAKIIRKELLQESRKKAEAVMEKISSKIRFGTLVVLPEMPALEDRAGIESRAPLDRLNILINVLESQGKQLDEWREKTIELLILPLVDEVCESIKHSPNSSHATR